MILCLLMLVCAEVRKRVRYRMLYVISHYPFSIRAPELCASRLDGTGRIQQELLQVAVRGRMQGEGK